MRNRIPEINAGSMADIAFLLLIFFLVTTTLNQDQGIYTKMPRKNPEKKSIKLHDKNILDIIINGKNELYVENEIISIDQLTAIALDFIDNGGGKDINGNACTWCQGNADPASSDHPSKALIAIDANRQANYETYIQVLDKIHSAYGKLRNRYAVDTYQLSFRELNNQYSLSKDENSLKKINDVRAKYPLLVSDSEINQ